MRRTEVTHFFSNKGTRNEVRMRVIQKFSEELPGHGRGDDASGYTYYVETLNNGDRVYLQRPANLYNGFDFLVCVENVNYAGAGKRVRNFPKHEDINEDLEEKKREDPEMYKKMYELLKKVYECEDVSDEEIAGISFSCGFSVDHIIKTIKWLFIEQDIRYWNYSGRNMTWGIVPEPEQ